MNRCEVVGVRNLADAEGVSCTRMATQPCSDCGIVICESHTETCGLCREVFCSSCFSFHQAEHSKPTTAVPSKGKNAELLDIARHRAIINREIGIFVLARNTLDGLGYAPTSWPPLRVPTCSVGLR